MLFAFISLVFILILCLLSAFEFMLNHRSSHYIIYDMCVVVVCIECSDIDVANTLVQLKRSAESRRRPLGCHNGSADRSSRSPSPPEFGTDYDRSFLRLKLRSFAYLFVLACVELFQP